jgi:hypothetical protein
MLQHLEKIEAVARSAPGLYRVDVITTASMYDLAFVSEQEREQNDRITFAHHARRNTVAQSVAMYTNTGIFDQCSARSHWPVNICQVCGTVENNIAIQCTIDDSGCIKSFTAGFCVANTFIEHISFADKVHDYFGIRIYIHEAPFTGLAQRILVALGLVAPYAMAVPIPQCTWYDETRGQLAFNYDIGAMGHITRCRDYARLPKFDLREELPQVYDTKYKRIVLRNVPWNILMLHSMKRINSGISPINGQYACCMIRDMVFSYSAVIPALCQEFKRDCKMCRGWHKGDTPVKVDTIAIMEERGECVKYKVKVIKPFRFYMMNLVFTLQDAWAEMPPICRARELAHVLIPFVGISGIYGLKYLTERGLLTWEK